MKALITRTSDYLRDYTNEDVKEINTIEDILALPQLKEDAMYYSFRGWVVIPRAESWKFNDSIDADVKIEVEIYDDYRE